MKLFKKHVGHGIDKKYLRGFFQEKIMHDDYEFFILYQEKNKKKSDVS